MRKLKITLGLMLAVWLIWWLGACFVEWYWLNPVACLLELPELDNATRGAYLAVFGFVTLICGSIAVTFVDERIDSRFPRGSIEIERAVLNSRTCRPFKPTPEPTKSPDATDIALGVGLGIIAGDVVSDMLD